MLRPDEVPSLKLRSISTRVSLPPLRRSIIQHPLPDISRSEIPGHFGDAGMNTNVTGADLELLAEQLSGLTEKAQDLEEEREELKEKQHFHLSSTAHDDSAVRFYTGFETLSALMVCFNFLGPAVNKLNYWASSSTCVRATSKSNKGRKRILSLLEEFFLVLVCLRLGPLEQDIANRFGISQSTVSRILITWINLLYLSSNKSPFGHVKPLYTQIYLKSLKKSIHLFG